MEEEMKQEVKGNHTGLLIACSAIGLCAGAVLGLLYAPRAGKETRAVLGSKFKAVGEAIKSKV